MRCHFCELVPRTNRQTIIATVYSVTYSAAELTGNVSLMFYRQIRDTARCVELVGLRKRVGWTDINAPATLTAFILARAVHRQF